MRRTEQRSERAKITASNTDRYRRMTKKNDNGGGAGVEEEEVVESVQIKFVTDFLPSEVRSLLIDWYNDRRGKKHQITITDGSGAVWKEWKGG